MELVLKQIYNVILHWNGMILLFSGIINYDWLNIYIADYKIKCKTVFLNNKMISLPKLITNMINDNVD